MAAAALRASRGLIYILMGARAERAKFSGDALRGEQRGEKQSHVERKSAEKVSGTRPRKPGVFPEAMRLYATKN